MTTTRALESIQEMADQSQKWHDEEGNREIRGSSSEGMTIITNKLNDLGHDLRRLKESVHAIQAGCEMCRGMYLGKDFHLKEKIKSIKVTGPMLATAHARIDVFRKKILLEVGREKVMFNANEGVPQLSITSICAINNLQVPNGFRAHENLEEFLMNNEINGDLGDFLELNDLLPENDMEPLEHLMCLRCCQIDFRTTQNIGKKGSGAYDQSPFNARHNGSTFVTTWIGLDDFSGNRENFWMNKLPNCNTPKMCPIRKHQRALRSSTPVGEAITTTSASTGAVSVFDKMTYEADDVTPPKRVSSK
nr:hypothetical protein [Tanacetum cinerariifolium]